MDSLPPSENSNFISKIVLLGFSIFSNKWKGLIFHDYGKEAEKRGRSGKSMIQLKKVMGWK